MTASFPTLPWRTCKFQREHAAGKQGAGLPLGLSDSTSQARSTPAPYPNLGQGWGGSCAPGVPTVLPRLASPTPQSRASWDPGGGGWQSEGRGPKLVPCITPALGRECRSLSSWWLEPLLLGGSVPQTLLVPKPSTWAGGPSHHSCAFLVWLGGRLAVRQRDFAVWDKEAALRVRGPLSPPAPPAVFPALH